MHHLGKKCLALAMCASVATSLQRSSFAADSSIPATAAAATASTTDISSNTTLQYFTLWDIEDDSIPADIKSFANFLFTTNNKTVISNYHSAAGIPSLLDVEAVFFCGQYLCPDYAAKWVSDITDARTRIRIQKYACNVHINKQKRN